MKLIRHLVPLAVLLCQLASGGDGGYHVTQEGNLVQVTSPWGAKIFFADRDFPELNSYTLEIPVALLKPVERPPSAGGEGGGGSGDASSGRGRGTPGFSDNIDSLVVNANDLFGRGKFVDSLKVVDEAIQRDPKFVRGWVMKGSLLHALGQKDLAKKAYERALELDPKNESLKNILGRYQ